MVEIDLVDEPNEGGTEWHASCQGTEDVAGELDALCAVQLSCADLLLVSAHGEGRPTCCSQVTHPLDFAPRSPDPPPLLDLDDGYRRRARKAAHPALDGDEPIRSQRHPARSRGLAIELKSRVERGTRRALLIGEPAWVWRHWMRRWTERNGRGRLRSARTTPLA